MSFAAGASPFILATTLSAAVGAALRALDGN